MEEILNAPSLMVSLTIGELCAARKLSWYQSKQNYQFWLALWVYQARLESKQHSVFLMSQPPEYSFQT